IQYNAPYLFFWLAFAGLFYICAGSGAVLLQPKGTPVYEVYIVKMDTVPVAGLFFGILFPGIYDRLFDSTKLCLFVK
ncbi:hypothetical protein ACLAEH_005313, partial [Escherichia coli]